MKGYTIERISSDRLKDLVPLYLDVFWKNVPVKYFQKKFDTKIVGAEYIGFIAYNENGSPAAYYGLFPCFAALNREKILAATSGDTMTHPAHRGKGLFVELASRTYELAKQSGIKFAYGFPNQNSLKGSVNLGWQYKGDHLKYFSMPVKTFPIAKLFRKMNISAGIPREGICPGDYFPNSLSDGESGTVLHDENYFKYKTYSPKAIITIAGAKLWMKIDGAMKIGDVERTVDFKINDFISGLKSYAVWRGITEIQFMVSNGTWLDIELSKMLIGKEVFPVGYFDFDASAIDLSKFKYGMCDLDTF